MKRFVIVFVALLLASAPALAQAPGGQLSVYIDASGSGDCSLVEQVFGINSIYVVHRTGPAAQAARFKVTHNWTAMVVQAAYPVIYLVDPDIFGGDIFQYGGCQTPPYSMARIDFLPVVPTPPCTVEFMLDPDPAAASGELEVSDCDGNVLIAERDAQWVVVNRDVTCACHADVVDTDESTWSRIKALYR